jgi:hypothetical protein
VTVHLKARDLKALAHCVDLKGVQSKSKFKIAARSKRTLDGIVFDSATEMRRYAKLRMWERGGLISDLECQVPYEVRINGIKVTTYRADFRYKDIAKNALVVEDVKSKGTRLEKDYRLRKRCVEAYYGIVIREILE